MTVEIKAYAKINLFLDVTGRRADGYHDIHSLMQTVSLYDTVTVSTEENAPAVITLSCDNESVPCNEKNLAYRAAERFYEAQGKRCATHIAIEKRIPMEAGLAGGSTDAAAALVALNRIFGEPFTTEAQCAIGKRLGADVPFCILGGSAEVTGIGDVLTPVSDLRTLFLVIAKDGAGVSTPQAYGLLDEIFHGFTDEYANGTAEKGRFEMLLSELRADSTAPVRSVYNVFEKAILPRHKEASELKELFLSSGAATAMMSGSGPSVFGVFRDAESAERVAARLNEGRECPIAFAVRSVGKGGAT